MLNVVIPVYKARDTLPELLAALSIQTYKMFIVTISQDGDGEDYSDILDEYRAKGLKIRLIKNTENCGPGIARQLGIDHSENCDYIMFVDADDLVTPRIVEVLYKEAKKNNVDVLTSDFIAETEHSSQYMSVQRTPITWFHGKIYKVDYLKEKNIRFLKELRLNEDSYFNLVAINSTKNKMKVQEYTYIWRYNKNSLTRQKNDEFFFRRSWQQYILSQIRGIQSIIEIAGEMDIKVLAATILNVFNHCMTADFLKIDYREISSLLEELKEVPKVQEYFGEKSFWSYIQQNLKGCGYIDGNLFFYKERFIDWFTDYILLSQKAISHSEEKKED